MLPLDKLGYFLRPSELFRNIVLKADNNDFIIEKLESILSNIEGSTSGTESEDDFGKLFEDIELSSTKLGKTPEARNKLISKVLIHLSKIDFDLDNIDSDVLGDAYEYLISQFASGAGKKLGNFIPLKRYLQFLQKLLQQVNKK